jgi:hypothetical protein
MMDLMKVLDNVIKTYVMNYLAAPVRWGQRVFGQTVPAKNDIRKGFLKDLTMLAEVAKLEKNQPVVDKIEQTMKANFADELQDLQDTLNG